MHGPSIQVAQCKECNADFLVHLGIPGDHLHCDEHKTDYQLHGDGVTDDTDTIHNALLEAPLSR